MAPAAPAAEEQNSGDFLDSGLSWFRAGCLPNTSII